MGSGRRSILAFLTGSTVAQAAGYAACAVVASRALGPHGRGLMVLGTTIASLTPLLAGLGTGSRLRAHLPNVTGVHRQRLLASYTWWSVLAVGLAGGLSAVLSVGSASFIDPVLADPSYLVALLFCTAGYVALTQFPDAWYAAGHFRAGGVWAAAMAAGGLVGLTVGVVVDRSAWVLLLAQSLGVLAVAAVQATRLHAAGLLPLSAPGRAELVDLLRSGWRALGLTTGLALMARADRYLLGVTTTVSTVGVYSLAATLSEAPRVVPAALGQILNRDVALGAGVPHARRELRLAVLSAAAMSVVVAVGGWLLVVPFFGAAFADARPLLLILLVAEVGFAPFAVASRGLLGGGWLGTAGALGAVGGLAAVALFAVVIPIWGPYGAAAACVVAYAGLSAAAWTLLGRRLAAKAAREPAEVPHR